MKIMGFQKAVKRNARLRLALCGPAGCGKTYTSLAIATALGKKVAYVDTEHGSASKYAHTDTCGGDVATCVDPSHFDFDVIEPSTFDPRELIGFIDEAIRAGYDVVCVDSLSHYWMGKNGELDLVDSTAARTKSQNSFAAWKTVTPIHTALVDKILSAPIHIIVSMRTKTEWVIEENAQGKKVPRKIGTAPIMRDGIEFEFDVAGDLDQENNLSITKSRCSALAGQVIHRPGKQIAAILTEWLAGAPVAQRAYNGDARSQHDVEAARPPQQINETGSQRGVSSDTPQQANRTEGTGSIPAPSAETEYRLSNLLRLAGKSKDEADGVISDLFESLKETGGEQLAKDVWAKAIKRFGDPDNKPSATDPVIRALFGAQEAARFSAEVNAA